MSNSIEHGPKDIYLLSAETSASKDGSTPVVACSLFTSQIANTMSMRIDLCTHPLYPHLKRYVKDNP